MRFTPRSGQVVNKLAAAYILQGALDAPATGGRIRSHLQPESQAHTDPHWEIRMSGPAPGADFPGMIADFSI